MPSKITKKVKIHFDNTSESMKGRTTKARNVTFYLDKIRDKGFEFFAQQS